VSAAKFTRTKSNVNFSYIDRCDTKVGLQISYVLMLTVLFSFKFYFYNRLLEQPRVSTEFGKRSFRYLSPKTWNSLPLTLRLVPTFDTFERHLKTYLFG